MSAIITHDGRIPELRSDGRILVAVLLQGNNVDFGLNRAILDKLQMKDRAHIAQQLRKLANEIFPPINGLK